MENLISSVKGILVESILRGRKDLWKVYLRKLVNIVGWINKLITGMFALDYAFGQVHVFI